MKPLCEMEDGCWKAAKWTQITPEIVRETTHTVTVRECTGSRTRQADGAPPIGDGTGFNPETDQSAIVPRNVRRRTRLRHLSPRGRTPLAVDSPARSLLRSELLARDNSISELRGQLFNAQNTAYNALHF